jgi:hypothetical protein
VQRIGLILAICAVVGFILSAVLRPVAKQEEAMVLPMPPGLVFTQRCADDHDPGVKISGRPCSGWEYSLGDKDVRALLRYLREIEALRERNP